MSNIYHIYRQHRGWSNSKGKDFWRKKARQVRESVETTFENRDMRYMAKMKRVLTVLYKIGPVRHRMVYVVDRYRGEYRRGTGKTYRTVVPRAGVYESHERVWEVDGMQWTRLDMAQAHRDGLKLHHARYLMTHGTPAAGL